MTPDTKKPTQAQPQRKEENGSNSGGQAQMPRRSYRPNRNARPNTKQTAENQNTAAKTAAPQATAKAVAPQAVTPQAAAAPKAINQRNNRAQKPDEARAAQPQNRNQPKAAPQKPRAAAGLKQGVQNAVKAISGDKKPRNAKAQKKPTVRIIPLGGLGEIGKNMTAYECGNDMFIVDVGLAFPDEEMFGVDIVIPDFSYVEKNKDKLRGIVLTHGHEDHIGALPYFLKTINVPVYSTRLTLGLVEGKLREHGLNNSAKLKPVKQGEQIKLGCFSIEFIAVNHSIPDACALAVTTPAGVIIQTGDFKVDYTPIQGGIINLARFGELGSQGVMALLADSTNAERPGSTLSERKVQDSIEMLFGRAAQKRIIVATFSSNIHRVQIIINCAIKHGRKVAVSGRSMLNVVATALELGYLTAPKDLIIDIDLVNRLPPEKVVLITTGSQGEPMSALSRMSMGEHRKVVVDKYDCIIISATPIPGNEKLCTKVINDLLKLGAEVVYESMYEVHASGHACQEELKLIQALVRPKFFVPVHGEYKHLKKHADLAISMGISPQNVLVTSIGNVIEFDGETMKCVTTVPTGSVMVDGSGVGDVGSVVLRDRKHLSEDGLIIVVATINSKTGELMTGPDIVSRGFVYVRESEQMMAQARRVCQDAIKSFAGAQNREWGNIKQKIRDDLGGFVYSKTKRAPMILPVIQEI